MADDVGNLPQLVFDGLPAVPCETAGFEFAHDQAPRRYPFVNGEGHDHTGRRSFTMPVRLHFVNTLALEQPDTVLFPTVFNQWFARLLDGKAGRLTHPILGVQRACVLNGSVTLVASNRTGVVVDVTFVETIDDPAKATAFTPVESPGEAARAADVSAEAVNIPYPTGEPLEGSVFDAVNSVTGQLGSLATAVEGKFNQVKGDIDTMVTQAEALQDHAVYGAVDNLTAAWSAVNDLAQKAPIQVSRETAFGVAQSDTTLDAIATATGNGLSDIMNLNPTLLRTPTISSGTRYRYYSGNVDATANIGLR